MDGHLVFEGAITEILLNKFGFLRRKILTTSEPGQNHRTPSPPFTSVLRSRKGGRKLKMRK